MNAVRLPSIWPARPALRVLVAVVVAVSTASGAVSRGAEEPPAAAIPSPGVESGHATARPVATGNGTSAAGDGWWGTVALALVVAAGAGAALVVRGRGIAGNPGSAAARVVGRVALGPRHAAYVVRVADRVLIVGTGGSGAPALLAELDADALSAPARESTLRMIPGPIGPMGGAR